MPNTAALTAFATLVVASGCTSTAGSSPGPTPMTVQPLPSPVGEARTIRQPDGSMIFSPASAPVEPGVPYAFEIFTHCGLVPTSFDFDGSFWQPIGRAAEGPNPPAQIGNPTDRGVIVLTAENRAFFTSRFGFVVPLARLEGPQRAFGCD
jgi:hypothetical protein